MEKMLEFSSTVLSILSPDISKQSSHWQTAKN